jgi:hypothetical protein
MLTGASGNAGLAARVLSTLLGAWLIVSVLAWPHDGPEGFNTLITGLLVLTVAPIAVWVPGARFAGAFLGAWLLLTTLVFDHASRFTFFHDLAAAVLLLVLGAVRGRPVEYLEAPADA